MSPPVVRRPGLAPPVPDPSPAGRRPPARRRRIIPGTFGELASRIGDDFLNNNGVLLVLLETPSGFAIFNFCGMHLYLPDAMQSMWVNFGNYNRARRVVWLKEFQIFDNKSSVINIDTGVDKQLTEMIMKWRRPGQELLVGKPEYKSVIESSLGIPCRHDELVMELMWGMKRFMPSLVRREKSELPKEDLLPMSQGLQMLLSRYGFDVKPEMVNDQIVATASVLFDCDAFEEKQYRDFHALGRHLKNVSGIEYENWGLLKLATAFKIICRREIGDPDEMLSEDMRAKLLDDADKYEKKINKLVCNLRHHEVVSNYEIKARHRDMLASLVKKAKEVHVL